MGDGGVVLAGPGWYVLLARYDEAAKTVTVDLRPVASWRVASDGVVTVATVWPGGSAGSVPIPDGVHVVEVGTDLDPAVMNRSVRYARTHMARYTVAQGKVLTPPPDNPVDPPHTRLHVVKPPRGDR